MKYSSIFKKFTLLLLCILFLHQCGIYRKTDARKVPVNAKDRVQKNIEEGRRIKFGAFGSGGSGNFEFASSNEMWRATIEILDFIPLTSVDYGGGVIITDWYNNADKENESLKIMVRFLSNEIRADGIDVKIYKKICKDNNLNCQTSELENTLAPEIKVAILKKAAKFKSTRDDKEKKEFQKQRGGNTQKASELD
jgi:hypothetical protein